MPFPDWEVGDYLTADELNARNPVLVYKTALESRASTITPVADSELSVPVKHGIIYIIESCINYSSSGTNAADLRYGWSAPTGTTMWWGSHGLDINATSPSSTFNTHFNTLPFVAGRGVGAVGDPTSFPVQVRFEGIVTPGADGDLKFLWAQWTSNATATTVREASFIKLTPMRRFAV